MKRYALIAVAVAGLALAGCSGMDRTEQNMLSGGAMGAAGGAAIGAGYSSCGPWLNSSRRSWT